VRHEPILAGREGFCPIATVISQLEPPTCRSSPASADVLRQALAPLRDLGVVGANTTRSRQRTRSDFSSFNAAGLPGIFIEQDPIQYRSFSWHTNLDTYERVIEGDAVKLATIIAAAVYDLAMREELLPRFTKDQMPQGPRPPRNQRN
jgi:carboxypeptidase Q